MGTSRKTIPRKILDLFPIWEYQCPKCNAYLGYEPIEYCVKCGAKFSPKKARIPPRFLKSLKAMSEYAHKVLAPKLDEKQRKLLFKYFTEIFNDGFESGDFSAWTGTSGSPTIVTTPVRQGTYAMEVDAKPEYAYKDFSEQSTCFLRIYARSDSLCGASDGNRFDFFQATNNGTFIGGVQWRRDGGDCRWCLWYPSGGSTLWDTASSPLPEVDTWYCIEAKYVIHSSSGEARLFIDGSEIITKTGLDSDNFGNIDRIKVGMQWGTGTIPTTVSDCVIVADTYIGLLSETYTKTYGADTLFKKLGITKAFSVDTLFQQEDISKAYTVDSLFQKEQIVQFLVDVLFKQKDITKQYDIDTLLKKLGITKDYSIDMLIKKLGITKDYSVDTLFKAIFTKAYGIDARFGVVTTLTKDYTVDMLIKALGLTKDYSVDTLFKKLGLTKSYNVDTLFMQVLTAAYALDVLFKQLGITKDWSIDTLFQKETTIAWYIDSLFKATTTKQYGIDAYFGVVLAKIRQYAIDVLFKQYNITKVYSIDARFGALQTHTLQYSISVIFYRMKLFGKLTPLGNVGAFSPKDEKEGTLSDKGMEGTLRC